MSLLLNSTKIINEWTDYNNHMNLSFYILVFDKAAEKILSQNKSKKELSSLVAEELAKKAKDMKITKVYFDRGVYKYHGRVKLLADELRKNGMEF